MPIAPWVYRKNNSKNSKKKFLEGKCCEDTFRKDLCF